MAPPVGGFSPVTPVTPATRTATNSGIGYNPTGMSGGTAGFGSSLGGGNLANLNSQAFQIADAALQPLAMQTLSPDQANAIKAGAYLGFASDNDDVLIAAVTPIESSAGQAITQDAQSDFSGLGGRG